MCFDGSADSPLTKALQKGIKAIGVDYENFIIAAESTPQKPGNIHVQKVFYPS